jgi:Uncharacterized conserved protein (DUF2190)
MHTQVFTHTVQATGSGVQRRFVTFDGTQAAAADQVLGVAKTDFATGQDFAVDVLGVMAVEAGGAVARGNPVIPDAQGRGVADAGNAANRVGRALNTVTAVGQTLFILIK